MKLSVKAAGSMILSSVASTMSLLAFLLPHIGRSDWALVLCWIVVPPLLLINFVYLLIDLARTNTRKQAVLAVLIVLPALLTEAWFFNNLRL